MRTLYSIALMGLLAAAVHSGAAITIGPDGLIYFNDTKSNTVWRIEADGDLSRIADDVHTNLLSVAEDGSLEYPPRGYPPEGYYFLVEAPDGTVYGTVRSLVVRVLPDGSHETVAGDTVPGFRDGPAERAAFDRPQGIDVDSLGAIYVADHGNRRVRRIATSGTVETVARSGWPWTPTGLVIKGDEVYVLERLGMYWGFPVLATAVGKFIDHPRVRVIRPDGTVEVVAVVPTEKEPARTMVVGALIIMVLGSAFLAVGRLRSGQSSGSETGAGR